mmetsp:Transcript_56204/g.182406  ORF Transcript_56204/g.182406 Transcript_56204/m.182406 type:complete len:242 (+) Transcript_56204:151-876(+)
MLQAERPGREVCLQDHPDLALAHGPLQRPEDRRHREGGAGLDAGPGPPQHRRVPRLLRCLPPRHRPGAVQDDGHGVGQGRRARQLHLAARRPGRGHGPQRLRPDGSGPQLPARPQGRPPRPEVREHPGLRRRPREGHAHQAHRFWRGEEDREHLRQELCRHHRDHGPGADLCQDDDLPPGLRQEDARPLHLQVPGHRSPGLRHRLATARRQGRHGQRRRGHRTGGRQEDRRRLGHLQDQRH